MSNFNEIRMFENKIYSIVYEEYKKRIKIISILIKSRKKRIFFYRRYKKSSKYCNDTKY